MIILDTNIISEMMRQSPSPKVVDWIDQQDIGDLYITAITIAEISYGINVLPNGKRRQLLEDKFHKTIASAFKYRVCFFDEASAYLYGKLMGLRKERGRPLSILDGQIAAIALSQEASVATRNEVDFQECGVELINPFQ